jgi:O-antigen/teichoic acid export membrane protein
MTLKKDILANYLGQGWSVLMSLAFIPTYINHIGIEAYALIGLFAIMQTWLSLLDMGMTPALSREMARFTAGAHTPQSIRDLLRSLEVITFIFAILIGLILFWRSGWLASHWLRVDSLSLSVVEESLAISALVISLRLCEGLYRSALIGLQQQVWCNIINIILVTIRHGGAVLILAYVSPTIQTFFIWQGLISLIVLVLFVTKLYRLLPYANYRSRFSCVAVKGIWRFAGGAVGINLLGVLLTQIDKVLLTRLLTLEYYGYYTLAAIVAGGLYLMVAPITQGIYPRLVQLHTRNSTNGLAHVYHLGSQLVTVVIAPPAALLFLYSEGFIFAWAGNPDLALNTASILSPLVLGSFLHCLILMPYNCQLASGWTSLTFKTNLFGVLILVPAIFWLVPKYGAIGAAWIWVVFNIGYMIITAQLMYRYMLVEEKWNWYLADILLPALGAILIVMMFQVVKPESDASRLEWGAFLLLCVGLAYIAAALLAGQVRRHLLTKIFRWAY